MRIILYPYSVETKLAVFFGGPETVTTYLDFGLLNQDYEFSDSHQSQR